MALLVVTAASAAAPAAEEEKPTAETLEQFALSNQIEIPSLPPGRWAWISREYPNFGGEWLFGDRLLVEMLDAALKHSILWDPLTGRGRRITVAQSDAMFHVRGNHLLQAGASGEPMQTAGGLHITQSITPGETFHCHPNLSVVYAVTDRVGGSVGRYLFILKDSRPRRITYRVCSEGNLPDHETTALAFQATGMDWVMLPNGTTLGFPLSLPFGAELGCILRLDQSFLQRTYLPGCAVQIDERLVDAGFGGENGGSPAFRAKLIQPIYEARVRALSQGSSPDIP